MSTERLWPAEVGPYRIVRRLGQGGMGDLNGDGTVEIVVSLKDAVDRVESVSVYTVPGSASNCLPWPTGRGNWLRTGWARKG